MLKQESTSDILQVQLTRVSYTQFPDIISQQSYHLVYKKQMIDLANISYKFIDIYDFLPQKQNFSVKLSQDQKKLKSNSVKEFIREYQSE